MSSHVNILVLANFCFYNKQATAPAIKAPPTLIGSIPAASSEVDDSAEVEDEEEEDEDEEEVSSSSSEEELIATTLVLV